MHILGYFVGTTTSRASSIVATTLVDLNCISCGYLITVTLLPLQVQERGRGSTASNSQLAHGS